jgi:hypothetical protein
MDGQYVGSRHRTEIDEAVWRTLIGSSSRDNIGVR